MSTTKRRLEKAEIETRAICPPERTLEDDLNWRLEEVLLHKRYFPFGSVMASLNLVENRKCFVVALEELQSPYREQVEEALAEFAVRHPAKWLLQYVVYVGFQHYHFGAPLRIPPQVCDWLLKLDPVAYGYKDDWLNIYAHDFCYDCGIWHTNCCRGQDCNTPHEPPPDYCETCGGAITSLEIMYVEDWRSPHSVNDEFDPANRENRETAWLR